jgi:hypothetical protein
LLEVFKGREGFNGQLLHEGILKKRGTGPMPRWQERFFTLQGTFLKYYSQRPEGMSAYLDTDLKGALDIREMESCKPTKEAFVFCLALREGRGVALLKAANQSDVDQWIALLVSIKAESSKGEMQAIREEVSREEYARAPVLNAQLDQVQTQERGTSAKSAEGGRVAAATSIQSHVRQKAAARATATRRNVVVEVTKLDGSKVVLTADIYESIKSLKGKLEKMMGVPADTLLLYHGAGEDSLADLETVWSILDGASDAVDSAADAALTASAFLSDGKYARALELMLMINDSYLAKLKKKIAIPNGAKPQTVACHPSQGWISVGCDSGMLKVLMLEPSSGGSGSKSGVKMNQSLDGHSGAVVHSRWSAKHQKLTTCDDKGMIIVWLLHQVSGSQCVS